MLDIIVFMGGGYYDRDVISVPAASYGNNVVGKESRLNKGLDPKVHAE